MTILKDAWADYRDESFIRQFLSRRVMRDFNLFKLKDVRSDSNYKVTAIHDERGYETIRETLADSYERHESIPHIEVVKVDPQSRALTLDYRPHQKRPLANAEKMIKHVHALWGRSVTLFDDKRQLAQVG